MRLVAGSLTASGRSELRRSTAATVNAPRMRERISNELRRGGNAAIIPRREFSDRAVRMAGHRSLSAEMINARSDDAAAAIAVVAIANTANARRL